MLLTLLFFCFVQISLLIPGYVVVKRSGLLAKHPGLELSLGYLVTIVFLGLLAAADYAFGINLLASRILCWIALIAGGAGFVYWRYYRELWKLRFPLICLVLMSLFSMAFVGLTFHAKYAVVPDPQPQAGRNYHVLNVKVLNIAQTQANDNYVPYRQAQFILNRSDPAKDSFIGEWGVTFFQRTPLMGAVTASYLNMLHEKPPIAYTWSVDGADPHHTYLQFQIIASVLNALFIVPAFFLLVRLFNKKTALITSLFLVPSQFFLYNAVFSWPKSLVAFFVLLSWLLLLENRLRYTILAGIAGGVAYLTHDLALLYLGASLLFLLWNRRFRDSLIVLTGWLVFALPWLLVSAVRYHKPSSFILYPLSIKDIPQPEQKPQIIHQFFHTSPLRLAFIRLENLTYLLSPFQLFTSEGGQDIGRRAWALGLFSIPGSVGIGLVIATVMGTIKRLQGIGFWILALTPVLLETVVIGWPKGLGALHFAEAVVVLFSGLGIAYLLKLRNKIWLLLAYAVNCVQLVFYVTYSFKFNTGFWLSNIHDMLRLLVMLAIVGLCGWLIHRAGRGRKIWIAAS